MTDWKISSRNLAFLIAFFCLLFFVVSYPFTRSLGGINLVVFSFACILFSFLISFYRLEYSSLPLSLLLLFALGCLYIVISVLEGFPKAWTRFFELKAIPQQSLFIYSTPFVFILVRFFCSSLLDSREARLKLAWIFFLSWLLLKIIDLVVYNMPFSVFASISGMGFQSSLIIVATSLLLLDVRSFPLRALILCLFSALSFLSPFSQNLVFALVFLMIWILPALSFVSVLFLIFVSVGFYAYFYSSPESLIFIDTNLFVRLVLIKDAFSGLYESYMIGLGFGTESLTNYYKEFSDPVFQPEDANFIHLAAHNSFATIAYRMGLLGFALLIWFVYESLKRISDSRLARVKAFRSSMFAAFFLVAFLNPALESYVYLYGVCVYLSLIWSPISFVKKIVNEKVGVEV